MGLANNAGVTAPFFQCILDADVLGLGTPVDPEGYANSLAQEFAGLLKKIASPDRAIEVQVFRSGRIRGEGREAALPPRDFWCFQMFIREKPVLESPSDVLPLVRNGARVVGTR